MLPFKSIASKDKQYILPADPIQTEGQDIQTGNLEVSGTGRLQVVNTGGSSASEGGVGSGSKTEIEKGEIKQREGVDEHKKEDDGFDPIKKHVEEKKKEQ